MKINIATDGAVSFVWSDDLAMIRDEGDAHTRRASHVEPTDDGRWTADMSPMGGPVLTDENGEPFALRADALAAEVAWLDAHMFGEVA